MATTTMTDPDVVVRSFFDALVAGSTFDAAELITDDVTWDNTGLPVMRGKRAVVQAIEGMNRYCRFGATIHHLAVEVPRDPRETGAPTVVLTERTDSLGVGRFRCDFWVCGRLEVRDGRICVWKDYFSTTDIARGAVRGMVGMLPGRAR